MDIKDFEFIAEKIEKVLNEDWKKIFANSVSIKVKKSDPVPVPDGEFDLWKIYEERKNEYAQKHDNAFSIDPQFEYDLNGLPAKRDGIVLTIESFKDNKVLKVFIDEKGQKRSRLAPDKIYFKLMKHNLFDLTPDTGKEKSPLEIRPYYLTPHKNSNEKYLLAELLVIGLKFGLIKDEKTVYYRFLKILKKKEGKLPWALFINYIDKYSGSINPGGFLAFLKPRFKEAKKQNYKTIDSFYNSDSSPDEEKMENSFSSPDQLAEIRKITSSLKSAEIRKKIPTFKSVQEMENSFVSPQTAGKKLGLGENNIYKLIKANKIEYRILKSKKSKAGLRKYDISEKAIEDFLQRRNERKKIKLLAKKISSNNNISFDAVRMRINRRLKKGLSLGEINGELTKKKFSTKIIRRKKSNVY